MQIVASLIRNNNQTKFLQKFKEKVAWVLANPKHLHHLQIFKVHLILDVQSQNTLHLLLNWTWNIQYRKMKFTAVK